jgi:hypothetical protein
MDWIELARNRVHSQRLVLVSGAEVYVALLLGFTCSLKSIVTASAWLMSHESVVF